MRLVIVSHPAFLNSRSMPLFAQTLSKGFGTAVTLAPAPIFHRIPAPIRLKKWLGYIDQYLIFPFVLFYKASKFESDTLFVFADQALGPWVPWLRHRPHVIHCHDLLALRSALGEVPENPTSFTGRLYQRFIRWGFSKGRNFISVSVKTRTDLHRMAKLGSANSVVVYNGLNYDYQPMSFETRITILQAVGLPVEQRGMLLHVGGAQWYKNRPGVVALYAAYAASVTDPLPLWMVGPKDQPEVLEAIASLPPKARVHLLSGLDARTLNAAYAHAALFLFPSLDEGFGWPIAEAQACGTLVLTTNAAPMTEVGGDSAFYLARWTPENTSRWARDGAKIIREILALSTDIRAARVAQGLTNVARFHPDVAIAGYIAIYEKVINEASADS